MDSAIAGAYRAARASEAQRKTMAVRYLFGDSGLFPGSNNFLELLRGLITHVGRAALIQAEVEAKERAIAEAAAAVDTRLQAIAGYFDAVLPAIARLADGRSPVVQPLATDLGEFARRLHDSTRSEAQAELEGKKLAAAREIAALTAEIPTCLNNFFVHSPPLEHGWAFSMRRSGEKADVSAVINYPQGIEAAFVLDPEPDWSRPRRVGEFASDVNVQVGMKKKLWSKAMVPERTYLNDHLIASLEFADEVAELVLRRKLDAEEGLMIRFQTPADEAPIGEVIKVGGEAEVHAATADDTAEIRRLVDGLRDTVAQAVRRRRRLLWVRLDEKDVLGHGLLRPMIERLVDVLAPLAQEISRRSPNRHELSLKVEHSDGRREEIYLKKDDLAQPLAGLPPEIWEIFGRLGVLPAAG